MPENTSQQPSTDIPVRSKSQRVARAVGKRLLFLISILVILRLTGCVESLFYQPTPGPTPPPNGVEGVWFNSADGTRLYGWWIPAKLPAGSGQVPTVIHVHGNAGNIESHEWFSNHLSRTSFNVFLFDFRGYGQSEGSARKRTPLIADTHAAVDYVLSRPDVDLNRIGLYGQSLGGAIGAIVFAERAELQAAVLESPFSSWQDVAANVVGGDPPNIFGRILAWILISDASRPGEAIHNIDRPILVLHGTDDQIVPHSHSTALVKSAGDMAELVSLEGGQHNNLKETHPEIKKVMIEFLNSHIGE